MILILHILVAFTGMALTGLTYVAPSKLRLNISLGLAAATLASGSWLLIAAPSHLVQACVIGLVYFSIVGFGIVAASRRLQTQ